MRLDNCRSTNAMSTTGAADPCAYGGTHLSGGSEEECGQLRLVFKDAAERQMGYTAS